MYNTNMIISNNRVYKNVYLEYDKDKFDIEYVEEAGKFLIRNLTDGQIMAAFDETIGFIIQSYQGSYKIPNFVVSSWKLDEEGNVIGSKLTHYKNLWNNELEIRGEFDTNFQVLPGELRMSDHTYLVNGECLLEDNTPSKKLYNLKKTSDLFYKVYTDPEVKASLKKITDKEMVLVSDRVQEGEVIDDIIYGLDPETFEAVTPIWSSLQQRFIEPYTDKVLERKGMLYDLGYTTKTNLTVEDEIYSPVSTIDDLLSDVRENLEKDLNSFNGDTRISKNGQLNKEFILSFKNRNGGQN